MNFTDREKELLLSNAAVYSRIKVYDENGAVLQVFNEDDYIVDWDYEDYRYVPDQGFIGQFVERLLDGHFMNIPENLSLENKEIEMEIAVKDPENNNPTYHSYGRFIITKIEQEDTTGSYKFEASDYTKKFNIPFTPANYPCLAITLLNSVCNQVGVKPYSNGTCLCYVVPDTGLTAGDYCFVADDVTYEFTTTKNLVFKDSLMLIPSENVIIQKTINADYTIDRERLLYNSVSSSESTELEYINTDYVDFVNNDFVIEDNQFEEDQTCRDVVCAIAKLGYTWARIGVNNKLHLDFTRQSESDIDTHNEIDIDKYYETTITGEKINPINKVLIGMSQVEGENIYTEQTADTIKLNTIYGDTSQNTYTGKNLLQLYSPRSQTRNGVTCSFTSDGAITINGTATANADFTYWEALQTEANQKYTLSIIYISGSSTGNVGIYNQDGDHSWQGWDRVAKITGNASVTNTYTTTMNCTTRPIRVFKGATYNDLKFKIQFTKGDADYEYEQYVGSEPSPNPDYPQNINTVTGRNIIKTENKNLIEPIVATATVNGVTVTNNGDGSFTIDGTCTRPSGSDTTRLDQSVRTGDDNMKPYLAGDYTLSCDDLPNNMQLVFSDYPAYHVLGRMDFNNNNPVTCTINDVEQGFFYIRWLAGATFDNVTIHPMCEAGSTTTSYEPYQSQEQEIDLGKNLFDIDTIMPNMVASRGYATGTLVYDKTTKTLTMTNVDNDTYLPSIWNNANNLPNCNIKAKKNTTYTLHFDVDQPLSTLNNSIMVLNKSTNKYAYISGMAGKQTDTFTFNTGDYDTIIFRVGSTANAGTVTRFSNFQLEEGEIATSYAPYYSVSKNLFDGYTSSGRWDITVGSVIAPNDRNGYRNSNPIKIKPNTIYTLSASFTSGAYLLETDKDNKVLAIDGNNGYIPINVTYGAKRTKTITTHSRARYLYWYDTIATDNPTDFMIEEGNVYTNYEPYNKHIELCKIGNYQDYITKNTGANIYEPMLTYEGTETAYSNCTVALNGDEYILTATGSDMYFSQVTNQGSAYQENKGKLYSIGNNTKVYLYCTNPLFTKNYITWYDENKICLEYTGSAGSNNREFTVPANAKYFTIRFGYGSATSGTRYNTRVMIGFKPITSYEPYGKDEWYEYHTTKKYIIAGREDIAYVSANSDANYSQFNIKSMFDWSNAKLDNGGSLFYCNQLSYYARAANPNKTQTGMLIYSNGNPLVVVSVPTSILTSGSEQSSYKEWLDKNNMILYTVIQNPEIRKITYQPLIDQLNAVDSLKTYEGKTYITSTGPEINAPINITVTNLEQETTDYTGSNIELIGHEYPESVIQIFDNPLTNTEELRRIAINGCERLYGVTYTPTTIDSIGHPWLEGNDLVKITNLENNDIYFYPFDRKIEYKGYITGTLSAAYENKVSQNLENNNNIIYRLTHTEISVDKANQKIESITQEVNDTSEKVVQITQDVNGVTTQIESISRSVDNNTEEIASIQETIDGLSIEKSITGGNNLVKNSVGYFGNDFWMINNDTEGNIKTLNDIDVKNNSVSASSLLLQNETVYQKITEIKNGPYYISFRYKKLLANATCKLIINGEEFNLTSTTWKDEGKALEITSNNIQLSLVSNMNDSCLITDLMLSNGTTKVSWTQNANETYTDGVKIGKGITITATGSDTELSATASSIDIVNTKNRENTSTFDKYGIKTNSLEAKGTVKIANKLIISKVGDQMWISTL